MRRWPPRGWALVLASLAGTGCGPTVGGGPLPWPPEARSALFNVLPEGSATPTWAWLRGDGLVGAEVELTRGGMATVFGFAPSLEALQVESGPLRSAPGTDEACETSAARSFPEVLTAFTGDSSGWKPTSTATLPGDLFLPALDAVTCVANGGCVDETRRFCRFDCPDFPGLEDPEAPALPADVVVCPSCPGGRPEPEPCASTERFDVRLGRCLAVGRSCPGAAPFPPLGPQDPPTRYIDPSAAGGGDGSRARPWTTLDPTLVPPGTRVWLAQGEHVWLDELVTSDLWLEGVCPEGTILQARLRLSGSSTVAEMQLGGRVVAAVGSDLMVRDLVVDGRSGEPDLVARGTLRLRRAVVRGEARTLADGRLFMDGVQLESSETPVLQSNGGRTRGYEVFVRSTLSDPTRTTVRSQGEARVELLKVVVQVDVGTGVALVANSPARLEDVVVLGQQGQDGLRFLGGEVELRRAYVSGFGGRLVVRMMGGPLVASDLQLEQQIAAGSGIQIADSAATIERVRIDGDSVGFGVSSDARLGPLLLSDLRIRGVNRGIRIEETNGEVNRAYIEDVDSTGIDISGPANLQIRDVEIFRTADVGLLVGSEVDEGIQGRVERLRVRRAENAGIVIKQIGLSFYDININGGVTGIEVTPGLPLDLMSGTTFDRISLDDHNVSFFMDRVLPPLAARLEFGAVQILDAEVGLQLSSCFPNQGAVLDGFRFGRGRALVPLLLTANN